MMIQIVNIDGKKYSHVSHDNIDAHFSRVVSDMGLGEIEVWKEEQIALNKPPPVIDHREYLRLVADLIEANGNDAKVALIPPGGVFPASRVIRAKPHPIAFGFCCGQIDADYDINAQEMGWLPARMQEVFEGEYAYYAPVEG